MHPASSAPHPEIVPFSAERAPYFDRFNRAWIEAFFWVEPFDHELLTDPVRHIIAPGGEIWFAELNGEVAGTAALLHGADGIFEFSKLGLAPHAKGRGIGRMLLRHCVARARERGAQALRIFTHSSLATACALYRAEGFVDVPLSEAERSRYARADTLLLLQL
jgi:ribosomal protein S18 acetylase RimI-like enzyme